MRDYFDISGKVAVITGAGGVLAGTVARHLGRYGVRLALLSRKTNGLSDLVSDINASGGKAKAYAANILSEESLKAVGQQVVSDFGRVDILLNIAGGNLPGATIGEGQSVFDMAMGDFNSVTELNLNGTVIPSLVFGKLMAEQGSGVVVNYSSMAVDRAITRVVGYSASKAAMENFTRWLAADLALKYGDGIRVNAIAPGFFIGNQNRRLLLNEDGSYTKRGQRIIDNTPMGRFGEAEELNGAIHFLCSDAARFITGVVLPIDGGFSAFSGV